MKTIVIYNLLIEGSNPDYEEDILLTEEEYDFDDVDFDDEESVEDFVVDFLHSYFDVDVIGYEYEITK